jgi:hypothetical protein
VWKLSNEPGVIFVFRQEALTPGSRCVINTPDRPRLSPVPQIRSRPADSPDAPDEPPTADELHHLLRRFLHFNQEEQRFYRSVLRGLIVQHLAALPPGADLTEIKGIIVKFHEVSGEIRNINESYATLGEALNTVLDAIDLNPQMATLLPVVLDERTTGTTQDPFLPVASSYPSLPALLKAVRRAEELSAR